MSNWEKVTTRSPYRADCGHGGEVKLYEDALRHFRSHRRRLRTRAK